MEICSEHNADIAYVGRECPVCEQIDDLNSDHQQEIDNLTSDFESDMNDMQDRIEELEGELEDASK